MGVDAVVGTRTELSPGILKIKANMVPPTKAVTADVTKSAMATPPAASSAPSAIGIASGKIAFASRYGIMKVKAKTNGRRVLATKTRRRVEIIRQAPELQHRRRSTPMQQS